MSTATLSYANETLTISLGSLANDAMRECAEFDNTASGKGYLGGRVAVSIKTGASGTSSSGYINVWAYSNVNGHRDGIATGSDAAITSNSELIFVCRFNAVANATTYDNKPFDVLEVFGEIPAKFGFVVENKTGAALDSTDGNHSITFTGTKVTVA